MIDQNTSIVPNPNSFLGRVSQHDAARKGAAAFVAGRARRGRLGGAVAAGAVDDALGDALLELVQQAASEASPKVKQAVAWLRDHAEPPQGVKLQSPDGTLYSGVAIVDRNNVVVLLAARHPTTAIAPRDPAPMSAPRQRYFEPDPRYDDPGDGWPPDPFLSR